MEILHVEKLTDEKWLNLYAATARNRGHESRWLFASRNERPYAGTVCNAVVMVAVLRDPGQPPRLVVVKEFRVPIGDYIYSLPAGLLDDGEDLEQAIRREMAEETGLEVTAVRRVTPPLFPSSGLSDEAIALAFVDVRTPPGSKQQLEGGEDIEVLLLDHAAVCRLCDERAGRFDAKAWAILYLYQQLGRID